MTGARKLSRAKRSRRLARTLMPLEEVVVRSKLLYLLVLDLDWIEGGFGLGYCLVSDYCGFEA